MKLRKLLAGTPARRPLTPAPDPRCTVTTKSGARCKLPRAAGSDKCAMHGAKP